LQDCAHGEEAMMARREEPHLGKLIEKLTLPKSTETAGE
jgi:hypothetical protein